MRRLILLIFSLLVLIFLFISKRIWNSHGLFSSFFHVENAQDSMRLGVIYLSPVHALFNPVQSVPTTIEAYDAIAKKGASGPITAVLKERWEGLLALYEARGDISLPKKLSELPTPEDCYPLGCAYFPSLLWLMNPVQYLTSEGASFFAMEKKDAFSSTSSALSEFLDPTAMLSGSSFVAREMIEGPSQSAVDSGKKLHAFAVQVDPLKPQPKKYRNPYPIPKRIDFSYVKGDGRSYKTGYGKVDAVIGPAYRKNFFLPLAELKGIAFNQGSYAISAGFIGRFLTDPLCEIFGFNLFYDFRQGRLGSFHQLGGGFEIFNRRWEVHANAYTPIGMKKQINKCIFDDYIGDYRASLKRLEFTGYGADLELGWYPAKGKNFQIYTAAGAYYLAGEFDKSLWGAKGTIRPQLWDYLQVEFNVTYDPVFETNYQTSFIFTLPLYSYSSYLKKKTGPCKISNFQVYQPVRRDDVIILERRCGWTYNWDND